MWRPSSIVYPVILTCFLILGGCGIAEPYVYKDSEFNRDRADFGKEPEDLNEVSICYNKRSTTAAAVRQLAEAECAKYKKVAVFRSHDLLECSLVTPARAIFVCQGPGNADPGTADSMIPLPRSW